jgi:Zn-dependent alcohol dehydrogenase
MSDVRAYLDFLCAHPELHDTIKQLISCYPVSQVNAAFDDAKAGNNVKTLLVK